MDVLVTPWQHQKLAVKRARELDYFGLFFEQGTGKSRTLIDILREKFAQEDKLSTDAEEPLRTLILCPPIVIENWKREWQKYSRVRESALITLTGTCPKRLETLRESLYAIYITNYQSLLHEELFEKLLSMRFEVVVLDESQKIKTFNSKTTKAVLALGARARYRYCLSGTPILNTISDIFSQVRFLDQGETFGNSYYGFRSKYYVDFNAGMPGHCYFPNWKMKPDSAEKIHKAIAPFSMRVLKKDCLDLPPLVKQRIDCPLTLEQSRVYNLLEREFVAELGTGLVATDLEITKALRLQQIVSGHCPNSSGDIHEFKGNTRLEVLRELLPGLCATHKALIWGCFRNNFKELSLLCSDLSIAFVESHGRISQSEQRANCARFQEDSNIRVLIGHPKSCGIGVNLTAASYSVFYSRGFSLEDDLQAEARNYRGGSEKHESVTRIDLVTPGTIDEVILEALAAKQSLSDAVLKHLKLKKRTRK